jgi:hypothetical protein
VWHASIARFHGVTLLAVKRWGEGVMRDAKRQVARALEGVGQGPMVFSTTGFTLHMRRSLADEEISAINPEWLAIPARDEFSGDGEIAMEL